jgi:hypothetical protein
MASSPPRVATLHRRVEQAAGDAGDDGGAGAGAAGQRLAGAALVDAQTDGVAVDHLHEAGVHPLREARMVLDQRALFGDRGGVDVRHHLHRVRIAHRQGGDLDRCAPPTCSGCTSASLSATKGTCEGSKRGTPMSTVTRPSSSRRGSIRPPLRLDADGALRRQALLVHEAHEAARAVAALLDLAAVGVEDAVAEVGVGPRGFLDDEDLVAADAEMAVGKEARLPGVRSMA